uniref:Uncharacterized protein n=1 Tax=Auxenochlorella protothecoides TaxID=3075 RepID=A0A1D2A625_AUXPR
MFTGTSSLKPPQTIWFSSKSSHNSRNGRLNDLHVRRGEGRAANRSAWMGAPPQHQVHEAPTGLHPKKAKTQDPRQSPLKTIWACAEELQPVFSEIDRLIAANVARTQRAFATARIGPHHFLGSTGYGHGDLGRGALDQIMADVMGMEAAAVRIQFVSGTHAIACALFGVLRPGDELLSVAGSPYDTLEEVIGVRGTPGSGSLAEHGVGYRVLPLAPGSGAIDWGALATAVKPETRMALLQRSCGYADRPTLSLEDIRRAVQVIKAQSPRVVVAVDNCYGEFTDTAEPGAVGADLCMGSLIKNPGGTLVPGGGYVAGKRHLVDAALARLTAPGIGSEAGAVNGETLRLMFQGLYAAPQTTGEALKGGRLAAAVMQGAGYGVTPASGACRPWSAITAIRLGSPHAMAAFASAVQASSPIGSYVTPTPGVTPGYADPVVFADGTFVAGSTSELGADGPIRPPYTIYCQGGTHWTLWVNVLQSVLTALAQLE